MGEDEAMDGVLALLQSTLRSVQEMQALASLPNNQLNCYRALNGSSCWNYGATFGERDQFCSIPLPVQPNEHCYRACRQALLQSLLEFRMLYSLQHLRCSSKLLDPHHVKNM